MKRTIPVCTLCLLWVAAVFGQQAQRRSAQAGTSSQLPAEAVIAKVKAATVFVRVKVGEEPVSCGSGFLVKKTGKSGYIATNEHVIARAVRDKGTIQVVLNSGTTREKTLPATVVAREELRDFALLKVEAPALPIPLNTAAPASIKERTFVYIFGFPFGELLSTGNRSPAVTVGLGAISSIRIDESGEPDVIQMEGEIHPGNSGGPVITFDGAVVGLTVAKIQGTRIGFAVPAALLQSAFEGKASSIKLELAEKNQGKVTYRAQVNLVDVLDLIQGVTLLICPTEEVTRKQPQQKNVWSQLSTRMKDHPLVVKDHVAEGQIPLTGKPGAAVTYCVQLKLTRRDRRVIYTNPWDVKVEFPSEVLMGEIKDSPPGQPATAARPSASSDWLGSAADQKKFAAANAGTSAQTGESLVESAGQVLDGKITRLKLDPQRLMQRACFSADGRFLYVLETPGLLRKVRVDDWTEDRQFLVEQNVTHFGLSKSGPVVLIQEKPRPGRTSAQVWLFDPTTLQVAKRFVVQRATALTASPAIDDVFVTDRYDLVGINVRTGDLTTHRLNTLYEEQSSRIRNPSKASRAFAFENIMLAPDGRYLVSASDSLHRFRLQGSNLVYEEISPSVNPRRESTRVTADGRCVLVDLSDGAKFGGEAPYVFNLRNLQQPPVGISAPGAPDVDPLTQDFYAVTEEGLTVISPKGVRKKTYPLTHSTDWSRCIPHPAGHKVLVLGRAVYFVELPVADTPLQRAAMPIEPAGSLRGQVKTSRGAEIVTVNLPPQKLLMLRWSAEGKSLYALETTGVLHRVDVPGMIESGRCNLNGECSWMEVAAEGVIVVRKDLEEIWVLDPEKLQVKRAIRAPGVQRIAACPALDVAYAVGVDSSAGRHLTIVDLKTGAISAQLNVVDYRGKQPPRAEDASGGLSFRNPTFTPDGKFILFFPGDRLHLFKLDGRGVAYEDIGPPIRGAAFGGLAISPDSKYVAVPNNQSIASNPLENGRRTYVFLMSDLRHPITTLEGTFNLMGFDQVAGRIYTLAHKNDGEIRQAIDVLRPDGSVETVFPLAAESARQLLVHPAGRKLALLTEKELLWITLPGAEKPSTSPGTK